MSTNQIGGNPAVTQTGEPVTTVTTTAGPGTGLANMNVPTFMQNIPKEELGLDLMRQEVSPPRLKIVQGQSKQEIKQQFGESATYVTPNNVLVSPPIDFKGKQTESEPIRVVPIFYYPEYVFMSPMGVEAPFIRERSLDPTSRLALRCMGQFEKRVVTCPEDETKVCKYHKVYNFLLAIWHPVAVEEIVVVSLYSSNFGVGKEWCKLCTVPRGVPCYGQVFELNVVPKKKDAFEYYGWQIKPAMTVDGTLEFVQDEGWFNWGREQHRDLNEKFVNEQLAVNYDEDRDDENVIETTATASKVGM